MPVRFADVETEQPVVLSHKLVKILDLLVSTRVLFAEQIQVEIILYHALFSTRLCVHTYSVEKVGSLSPQRDVGSQAVPFGQVLYDEFDILVLHKQWRCMQGGGGRRNDRHTPFLRQEST